MSDAFEKMRDALTGMGSQVRTRGQGSLMAQCPGHDDKDPSLEVKDKGDRIGVHCYGGCNTDDIIAILGLTMADLFDGEPTKDKATVVRSYMYVRPDGAPWIIKDRYFPKTFIMRLPGTDPGDRSGLKVDGQMRPPILYRADKLFWAMRKGDAVVYLVEGEKDVETCERHGLLATCTPGGAGTTWRPDFTAYLKDAAEVTIVVDQDQMKEDGTLGPGQQYARAARDSLKAAGIPVKMVAPAVGKDATDHFEGGYTADDWVVEPTQYLRPRGLTAPQLMEREYPPLIFPVKDVLPAGLAIMAGSPKAGKTWAALDFACAVALGGPAMSLLQTTQGSVLCLAREDGYRRLQSRLDLILGGSEPPSALEVIPTEEEWVGGEIGIANMEEWAEEVGDPRLVVIDTLAKVEPEMGEQGRGGAYAGNYSMMARYKAWADRHNCCVLMIHHDNKTKIEPGSDPFSRISGTRGLTGAADTLLFLETKPKSMRQVGEPDGQLHITGRDVSEQTLELRKTGPLWQCEMVAE